MERCTVHVMKRLFFILLLSWGAQACVVKDEQRDGLREMRSELAASTLTRNADGSGTLDFTFEYGIALVDDDGVQEMPWSYRLVDRARRVLAENEQVMRKAEPGVTDVLVTGERKRKLELPPGAIAEDGTYVLWIVVQYRAEVLHEALYTVNRPTL